MVTVDWIISKAINYKNGKILRNLAIYENDKVSDDEKKGGKKLLLRGDKTTFWEVSNSIAVGIAILALVVSTVTFTVYVITALWTISQSLFTHFLIAHEYNNLLGPLIRPGEVNTTYLEELRQIPYAGMNQGWKLGINGHGFSDDVKFP